MCCAALGLANKAFASDFNLPASIAIGSGLAELAGAYMMYMGGDLLAHGALLLAVIMGGAILTMLRSATPFLAPFPATCAYGLWYVLAAARKAQPAFFAAALAAGAVGNLVFAKPGSKGRKVAAKKPAAKAAGKKGK